MGSLPHVVEDCFGLLKLYSDGSISRNPEIPSATPLLNDASVLYKDFLFDSKENLHLRLYKPTSSTAHAKLPILFYFHGGGFCFGSRSFPHFHNLSIRLAAAFNMLVIAPDHRLAPENRLPAAVDDACQALKWLQGQAMHGNDEDMDTLLTGVDFDRVFVLGDSSGGNLAHHLAVRFKAGSIELAPVRVRGYVLLAPFFGGIVRTRSEEERPCEAFWNLEMYERFWRLSIPAGSTLDHPLVNPFGPSGQNLAEVPLDPILVVVGGGEILRDRVEDYAARLKHLGKKTEFVEFEGQQHGFLTDHPFSEVAEKVIQRIRDFILENSN
ncbi:Alpha/beta-Hydrolases superfamily protein, putative [Theobroma cacao]|uniref:Alpha/beta-Hydrolases superfamily protein, putative n=1 Tax=Theobroma cacao TaxID=3641 RepID=A0A061F2H0_THECC|nr:Alpha/beta-Hydrolases superfamily protein, putative [Theobroma cacao]